MIDILPNCLIHVVYQHTKTTHIHQVNSKTSNLHVFLPLTFIKYFGLVDHTNRPSQTGNGQENRLDVEDA